MLSTALIDSTGPVAVPAHQDHHPAAQEAVLDLVVPAVLDQAEVPVPAVVVPRVVEAPEEEGAKEARKINLQLKISLKTKTRRVNQGRCITVCVYSIVNMPIVSGIYYEKCLN